jgi:ribosome-binding protein aMBF1 (putative translation factor)
MKAAKRKRLVAGGWVFGDAKQFLGLNDEEAEFIELKLALVDGLRKRRLEQDLTQKELAKRLDSSQSRVAKMEAGDRTVTLDLLMRSLLTMGMTRREIAKLIAGKRRRRAA